MQLSKSHINAQETCPRSHKIIVSCCFLCVLDVTWTTNSSVTPPRALCREEVIPVYSSNPSKGGQYSSCTWALYTDHMGHAHIHSPPPPAQPQLANGYVVFGAKLRERRGGQTLGEDVGKLGGGRDTEDPNITDQSRTKCKSISACFVR
jgi:hypothetical protein